MATNDVFLDSSFAIALLNRADTHNAQARQLALRIRSDGTRLITTVAVIIEIANALSRLRFRTAVVELLDSLTTDTNVKV